MTRQRPSRDLRPVRHLPFREKVCCRQGSGLHSAAALDNVYGLGRRSGIIRLTDDSRLFKGRGGQRIIFRFFGALQSNGTGDLIGGIHILTVECRTNDLVICADLQLFAVFQSVKGHGSNGRIGAAVIGLVSHGHVGDGQYRRSDVPFLGYRPGVVAGAGDPDRCLAHIGVRAVGNGVIPILCQRRIAVHRNNHRLDRQSGIGLVGEIADRDLGQRLRCDGEHIGLVRVRAVLPNGVVLVLQLDSHILAACLRPRHSARYGIVGRIGGIAQNIGLLLTRVFKLREIFGRDGDLTLADGEIRRAGADLGVRLVGHGHGIAARAGRALA